MNEGKKDRRDPIRTIKAKNPVAKNASAAIGGGAAGAHKDKKKAMKQGEVKHKKAEYAESYEQHLQNKLDEAAKVDPNAPFDYDKWKSSGKTTTPKHFGPKGAGTKLAQQTRDAEKKKEQGVAEGKSAINFSADDLKRLEKIRDLPTLKAQAFELISKPSAKPMKPEKVEWFKQALENMNSPIKVIKLMYDLLLSGEGNAVVGSKSSMNPNSYRQRFGEQGMAEEMDIPQDGTPEYDQFIRRGGVNQKTPYDLGGADAYYDRQHDITQEYGFQKGSPEWDEYGQGYRDTHSNKDMRKDYGSSRSAVQPRRITRTGEAMNGITGPGRMDGPLESEGDKEGLPHLTKELASHIAQQIDTEGAHAIVKSVTWGDGAADDLVQFIKKALETAVGGNVAEGTARDKWNKASDGRKAKHDKIEADRKAAAAQGKTDVKGAVDRLEKAVNGEGWTHDSLADRLFEHERTYEEKLQNQLNKRLGK